MSRAPHSPSIQLFPFLAVLVCAMGALILLLLVTTSKMIQAAVARAAAQAAIDEEASRPPKIIPAMPPQMPEPQPVPTGPTPDEVAQKRAERTSANTVARKRQATRQAEWHRSLAEAEIARDQRRQRLAESEAELTQLQQKLEETETHLQGLADKKSKLKTVFEKESALRTQAEREHERLTDAITTAQKQLADIRRAHAAAASKFAFIPYDGASGTTRRPIYLECTSTGIRFQPEDELLDESDLKGFTETFNPLLSASQQLMQYWREQSVAGDDPQHPTRPYILILVRPKGTVAYYVARKMLSRLGDDFGYELIEDDFQLQLPAADPEAKLTIQRAVAETLKNRGEMIAVGSRVGAPRLGEVLMGRNEELIEFGTLDAQVAASVARDESPFTKNSSLPGRGFQVTRSPIEKGEIKSGGLNGTRAERDRRRAQGVPGSLAEMARPGGPPDGLNTGPQGGIQGTDPGGATRPAGVAGSTTGGNSTGSDLIDPFARDEQATGQRGAGTAGRDGSGNGGGGSGRSDNDGGGDDGGGGSNGEGVAGDATSFGPGSRPATRRNNAIPHGARAGKVIELPAKARAIGDETGTAADGDVATDSRTTPGSGTNSRTASQVDNGASRGARAGKAGNQPANADAIRNATAANGDVGTGGQAGQGAGGNSAVAPRSNQGSARAGQVGGRPSSAGEFSDPTGTVSDGNVESGGRGAPGANGTSRSNSRLNNSAARGARPGKVIDMPANAEPIPDGPNTFSKPQESASSGNPGTSVSGGDGRPGDGRQRAGVKSRSTDPHAKSEPSHGDNPEARRQMAASSGNSARTTMQKRDSARRRWGGTNTGQIGFERKVHVAVTANRIFIGENDIEVVIEPGTKPEELLEAVLSALDEHSRAWGKPPNRFYWVPYISFDVYSGASSQHERLNGPLREWGIFSEAKFKEGDKPPALKTEQTENPILLASKQAPNNATPSKTPRKLIGPKEAVANKPAGDKVPTAEKSRFSWFKNSWFKKISN